MWYFIAELTKTFGDWTYGGGENDYQWGPFGVRLFTNSTYVEMRWGERKWFKYLRAF